MPKAPLLARRALVFSCVVEDSTLILGNDPVGHAILAVLERKARAGAAALRPTSSTGGLPDRRKRTRRSRSSVAARDSSLRRSQSQSSSIACSSSSPLPHAVETSSVSVSDPAKSRPFDGWLRSLHARAPRGRQHAAAIAGDRVRDSVGLKLTHSVGLKLIHPPVQYPVDFSLSWS